MKARLAAKRGSAIVKIGLSRQIAIPKKLHDELGLSPGDFLRVEVEGDRLILIPQTLIERRLAEGFDDVRQGRVKGPFGSVRKLVESLGGKKKQKSS